MSLASEKRLAEYYRTQLGYAENRIKRLEAGKPDKRSVDSATFTKRQRVWQHNSFKGHCAMALKNFERIRTADSTTDEAKRLVQAALAIIYELQQALTERKD